MTVVAIHQPQYVPYPGFFHKIGHSDIFVALDNVQFQKNGIQNRNKIKHSQGWQWLTVPVLHQLDQDIKDVQINPKVNWRRKHWAAIQTSYARAPYFDAFQAELAAILLEGSETMLSPVNMRLTEWVNRRLGLTAPIIYGADLDVSGSSSELLIAICQAVNADTYLSGPGGRNYMDLEAFAAAGIEVKFQSYAARPYPQLFPEHGFIANLSILDTLFNCGVDGTLALLD